MPQRPSPRSGYTLPPPMEGETLRRWLEENDRLSITIKSTRTEIGMIWMAMQDPWVGCPEIADAFPKFPRSHVRRLRRLTSKPIYTNWLLECLPNEMVKPLEWYRNGNTHHVNPEFYRPRAHVEKNRRQCPPHDVLFKQFDMIRIDGRHTLPRSGGSTNYFDL